jgi:Na+/phosphate symporter
MDTGNYVQILIDSLIRKEVLLKKVVDYNEEQEQIASASEFDEAAFQSNLDAKGEAVDEILKLDDGFQAVFDRVKEVIQNDKSQYAGAIATLQQLIKSVTDLGVRIQAQELRNKTLVEKRFAQLRKELSTARTTTSKANEYYKNMNRLNDYDAHFLDQKK